MFSRRFYFGRHQGTVKRRKRYWFVRKVTNNMRCVYFSGNFGDRYFGTDDY